mmetsp:Transcript_85844/g.224037  ORF Transcript_85844/g.224037 Transcript_85844/m.224037 type:complete len:88 (+) Transcript_85844:369-632(+)
MLIRGGAAWEAQLERRVYGDGAVCPLAAQNALSVDWAHPTIAENVPKAKRHAPSAKRATQPTTSALLHHENPGARRRSMITHRGGIT